MTTVTHGTIRRRRRRSAALLAASAVGLAAAVLAAAPPSAGAAPATQTTEVFDACGGPYPYEVPPDVYALHVHVFGAEGGDGDADGTADEGDHADGGLGGGGSAFLNVSPGWDLGVYVGCQGADGDAGTGNGGAGGSAGSAGLAGDGGDGNDPAGGGGGASAITFGFEILAAGGGGGGGAAAVTTGPEGRGGAGGGLAQPGGDGHDAGTPGCAGDGAETFEGGAAGTGSGGTGQAGSAAGGGDGADVAGASGGGGGGGYYGGGGGGGTSTPGFACGGGGGGSGEVQKFARDVQPQTGVRAGDGLVVISTGVPSFSDVPTSSPFFSDIEWMASTGVSEGYPDGTYRPASPVSRQAMSAFMDRFPGLPGFFTFNPPTFTDVPEDHPFFREIEFMAFYNISDGYPDGTFRPADPVTRQAMSAFMYRFAGSPPFTAPATPSFTDVAPDHAFYDEVEWMADEAISTGYPDGTYRPSDPVTRLAMSAFLLRLYEGPGADPSP